MKKSIIFLLFFLICIVFSACAKENKTADTKDTVFYLPPDTYKFYKVTSDSIVIVQWGKKCQWSTEITVPDGSSCYAIKYLDIIEATFQHSEIYPVTNLQEYKKYFTSEESFYSVENQYELRKKYDDIIIVSDHMAEKLTPGDVSLIDPYTTSLPLKEHPTITYSCPKVTDGNIIPIVDGCLSIPEEAYELKNGKYGFRTLENLLKANELIRETYPNLPVFESGITIEELKKYYNMASEVLNQ